MVETAWKSRAGPDVIVQMVGSGMDEAALVINVMRKNGYSIRAPADNTTRIPKPVAEIVPQVIIAQAVIKPKNQKMAKTIFVRRIIIARPKQPNQFPARTDKLPRKERVI